MSISIKNKNSYYITPVLGWEGFVTKPYTLLIYFEFLTYIQWFLDILKIH